MSRIYFEDLPSTNTPRNATNLNKLNNIVISSTEPNTGEEVWIDDTNKKIYTLSNGSYNEFYDKNKFTNKAVTNVITVPANSTSQVDIGSFGSFKPILLSLCGTGNNFETHKLYVVYRVNRYASGNTKLSDYNYNLNDWLQVTFQNDANGYIVNLQNISSVPIYAQLTLIDLY